MMSKQLKVLPTCLVILVAMVLLLPTPTQAHSRPSFAALTRSLLAAGRGRVAEMRRKTQDRVGVLEVNGRFMRAPQPLFGDVQIAQITPVRGKLGQYAGVVRVAVVWRSPDQSLFNTRQEAKDAELTESETTTFKLLYIYRKGRWTYQRTQQS